ncbi:MAG: hypothetical protein Q7U04_13620 [Bacteriovorax sp.]|nr:hypothetical protein [Bacteriovorax sp.]
MENKKAPQFIRLLLLYPIALILIFEEWGWEPLARFFAILARHPFWGLVEKKIQALPPRFVLFVFGAPVLMLLPVKIFAIYLFGKGHLVPGTILLVGAKICGTAICARIFQLTKPSLMKINWFAKWYPRWKVWKDDLLSKVKSLALWKQVQLFKRHLIVYLHNIKKAIS